MPIDEPLKQRRGLQPPTHRLGGWQRHLAGTGRQLDEVRQVPVHHPEVQQHVAALAAAVAGVGHRAAQHGQRGGCGHSRQQAEGAQDLALRRRGGGGDHPRRRLHRCDGGEGHTGILLAFRRIDAYVLGQVLVHIRGRAGRAGGASCEGVAAVGHGRQLLGTRGACALRGGQDYGIVAAVGYKEEWRMGVNDRFSVLQIATDCTALPDNQSCVLPAPAPTQFFETPQQKMHELLFTDTLLVLAPPGVWRW